MMLKLVPRELEGVVSGVTRVPVRIRNLFSGEAFTTDFLVDTGYRETMIPASLLKRIGIEPEKRRTYELPNGQLEDYDVGVAELSFLAERIATQILFVFDDTQPLLGRLSLAGAGISIEPKPKTTEERTPM